MQYNRDMVGLAKERRIMRRAKQDDSTKLVLLMNEFHSCDLKYFPSEEDRSQRKEDLVRAIKKVQKRLPGHIAGMVDIWMAEVETWRAAVESTHSLL